MKSTIVVMTVCTLVRAWDHPTPPGTTKRELVPVSWRLVRDRHRHIQYLEPERLEPEYFQESHHPYQERREVYPEDHRVNDEFPPNYRYQLRNQGYQEHQGDQRAPQQRQALSFGGHGSHLNFGDYGLGFASVPASPTPLTSDTNQPTAPPATASPSTVTSTGSSYSQPPTVEPKLSSDSNQAPDATASVSSSTKPATSSTMPPSRALADSAQMKDAKPALEINATPATASSAADVSKLQMALTSPGTTASDGPTAPTPVVAAHDPRIFLPQILPHSYVPLESRGPVQAPVINYIFPEQRKTFSFQRAPQETLNYASSWPISGPAKFGPAESAIPGASPAISGPSETLNFIRGDLPKLPFVLPRESAPLPSATGGPGQSLPTFNFGQPFAAGQQNHVESAGSGPFSTGFQLQLGGFGGIDYSGLQQGQISRVQPFGIAKVGLSRPEPPRPPVPAFTKIGFGFKPW